MNLAKDFKKVSWGVLRVEELQAWSRYRAIPDGIKKQIHNGLCSISSFAMCNFFDYQTQTTKQENAFIGIYFQDDLINVLWDKEPSVLGRILAFQGLVKKVSKNDNKHDK